MYEYPEEQQEMSQGITPGEGQDAQEVTVDGYTYPTDEYGYAVRREYGWAREGEWYTHTTDPYGHLSYSFSFDVVDENGGCDFTLCLDYLVLEAHVAFHAVRDSDSGGYIEDADYRIVKKVDAVETAQEWADWATDEVFEVYYMNAVEPDGNEGRLDDEYNNYPPEIEEFDKIASRFVQDVTDAVKED